MSDNKSTNVKVAPKQKEATKSKSVLREIMELLFIALILVPAINIFVLQSYAIPTSSMEGEMLVGDKLFVSKLSYGPRVPNTPLALPYVHNSIFGTKSYSESMLLPYNRLPGFSDPKRDDIIVFNLPRDADNKIPVDRRTNYVKRCVAQGGDTLQIKDRMIYIDGKAVETPENAQYAYEVRIANRFATKKAQERFKSQLNDIGIVEVFGETSGLNYVMMASKTASEALVKMENVTKVEVITQEEGVFDPRTFPGDPQHKWNIDFYGPIYIPKTGDKITLDTTNYSIYERVIKVYENNPTLEFKDNQAYIDGKPIDAYEFKMSYFWMMGDNRHNSEDSRYWGMVPEDHIVGKPVFVWLSTSDATRGTKEGSEKGFFSKLFSGDIGIRWGKSMRLVN
ncbi:MAG: signal peptidase I [Chitinophagales bacterium]